MFLPNKPYTDNNQTNNQKPPNQWQKQKRKLRKQKN